MMCLVSVTVGLGVDLEENVVAFMFKGDFSISIGWISVIVDIRGG